MANRLGSLGTTWGRSSALGWDVGLVCLSGLLLFLSFPEPGYSVLVWIALVPWLVALEGKSLARAWVLSSVAMVVCFTGVFYWIWTLEGFHLLHWSLLALYLSLYGGTFGLGLTWIRKRLGLSLALAAPPLWVTLEYARAHASFLSAPWMLLGHSQYLHPSLIQISDITGVYGLSFLIVVINGAIAEIILSISCSTCWPSLPDLVTRIRLSPFLVSLGVLGGVMVYGNWNISSDLQDDQVRLGVVQGNIPQDRKWDQNYRQEILQKHIELTTRVALDHPDLIIWPETAVPGDVQNNGTLQKIVGEVARETQSALLVGSGTAAKFRDSRRSGRKYNSMVLFSAEGKVVGEYRKIHLVPFGEYVPFREKIPWPSVITSGKANILPGDQFTLFTLGDVRYGATICWETIFPDLVRNFVKRGARFIVNAANEAWFGETGASSQFLAMNVFRAVENRVTLVRAANTGVSCVIDPFGRILGKVRENHKEIFVAGVLAMDIPLGGAQTFYTVYGDVFAQTSGLATLGFIAWPFRQVKRSKRMVQETA